MEKKRSKGVTIIAWYFIIASAWFLLSRIPTDTLRKYYTEQFVTFLAVYIKLIPIVYIILGGYVLKLKEWARKGFIAISMIQIFLAVLVVFDTLQAKNIAIVQQSIGALAHLIIIYFFTRPKVKEQFK